MHSSNVPRCGIAKRLITRLVELDRHAFRHANGGALATGFDHDFSPDCFLDSDTRISGRTILRSVTSIRSTLNDVIAFESKFTNCLVTDAIICRSTVDGPLLTGVVVDGAVLSGKWRLEGLVRIHGGVWVRPPMFQEIKGENGLHIGLTECHLEGRVHFSSRCHEAIRWQQFGPRLGRRLGWTEEQIKTAYEFCEAVLESQRHA